MALSKKLRIDEVIFSNKDPAMKSLKMFMEKYMQVMAAVDSVSLNQHMIIPLNYQSPVSAGIVNLLTQVANNEKYQGAL